MAALGFWATHFPEGEAEHYVFPSERYGAAGDKFCAKAYDVDPTKPIGSIKQAWEAAKLRAARILKEKPDATEKIAPLPCRFRDLRHTAVSRMLNAGVAMAQGCENIPGTASQWLLVHMSTGSPDSPKSIANIIASFRRMLTVEDLAPLLFLSPKTLYKRVLATQ